MTTRKYISKPAYEEFIRQTKRATRKGEHKVKQDLTECGWTFEELSSTVLIGRPPIPSGGKRRTHIEASKVLGAILGKRKEPESNSSFGKQTEIPFPQPAPTSEPEPETSIIKAEVIQLPISPDQIVDIVALKNNQGVLFTVVAKTCEVLDIGANNQIARIRERDDWLSADIRLQLPGDTQSRVVFCIAVEFYEAWLNSINRNKVAERARPALIKLQAECTKAIRNWFHPEAPQATEAPQESPLLAFIAEMREDRRLIMRLLERMLTPPTTAPQNNLNDIIVNATRTATEVAVGICEVAEPGVSYIRPGVYNYKGIEAYTSWMAIEILVKKLNNILTMTVPDLPSLEHHFARHNYGPKKLTASRLNQLASIRPSINRNAMPLALLHLQDRDGAPKENRLWTMAQIDLILDVMQVWCSVGCPDTGHEKQGKWMWDEKVAIKNLTAVGITNAKEMVDGATKYLSMLL